MTLDTTFRYADITKKPRPPKKKAKLPRDGDGDGNIYDDTPQERPAPAKGWHGIPGIPRNPFSTGPEQNRWWQDDAKRKAYMDWKRSSEATIIHDRKAEEKKYKSGQYIPPSEVDFTYAPNKTPGNFNSGEVAWAWVPFVQDLSKGKHRPVLVVGTIGADQVVVIKFGTREPKNNRVMLLSQPVKNETQEGFADYAQLIVLDRSEFKQKMDVFPQERYERYVDRAIKKNKVEKEDPMLDETFRYADIVKAKKPKDADGDGLVYDGTPRERPALPSEKVPGARKPAARGAKVPRRPKSPVADGKYEVSGVKGNRIDIRQSPDKASAEAEGKKMVAEGYKDVVAKPKGRKAPAKKAPAKKPAKGRAVALAPEDIARPDKGKTKVSRKPNADSAVERDVQRIIGAGDTDAQRQAFMDVLGEHLGGAAGRNKGPARQKKLAAELRGDRPVSPLSSEPDSVGGNEPGVPKRLKADQPAPKLKIPTSADPTHASVDMDEEIPHEEFFGSNIFGQDADSNAAEYWRRAMYAAMRGDKDGYLENMDNFFKEEEAIPVDKESDRTEWANSVMDFVDGIFDEADPEGAEMAVDNIEAWDVLPSKLRKDRKKNGGKPPAVDVASADQQKALVEHLKNGGGIGDAPHGDLVSAMREMPERFDFQYLGAGAGGVSDSFWVVDKKRKAGLTVKYQTGTNSDKTPIYGETDQELFFVKKSAFQDDVLAEIMAGKILADTDLWEYNLDVKWGAPPQGGRGSDYVVMPHAGQMPGQTVWVEMAENAQIRPGTAHILDISDGVDEDGEFDGIGAIVRDGPDPGSYLRMNLYDWFINNSEDRHWKNLLGVVGKDGVYIAPIDQGLAFWNGADTPDAPLERFLNSNWRNRPIDNMVNAVEILEGDRAQVLAEIESMNAKMKKADIAKMKADMKKGPPKMNERMSAMIDVWFDGMQAKVDWMAANPEEAADVVMKAGTPKRKGRRK